MKPNARILVATDLGEAGDQAIQTGDVWAKRHGGALIVMHVVPDRLRHDPLFPQRQLGRALETTDLEARAGEAIDARVRELTGRSEDQFEVRVTEGSPAERILEVADEVSADMVVLGGRAPGGKRWVFGSVAERVVTHAEMPVLVARPTQDTKLVLAATDLSEPSLPAVDAAKVVAKAAGAKLSIVHVVDAPHPSEVAFTAVGASSAAREDVVRDEIEAARTRLRDVMGASEVETEVRVVVGEPSEAIVDLADDLDPDVLVVASRGRTGLSRLLLGSVAARVLRHAPCSVLVVRLRG